MPCCVSCAARSAYAFPHNLSWNRGEDRMRRSGLCVAVESAAVPSRRSLAHSPGRTVAPDTPLPATWHHHQHLLITTGRPIRMPRASRTATSTAHDTHHMPLSQLDVLGAYHDPPSPPRTIIIMASWARAARAHVPASRLHYAPAAHEAAAVQ